MPPGIDPGGFQSATEFSDAIGLTRETLGYAVGANVIQAHLNEGANPAADYPTVTTGGGTVAYDTNKHSGSNSLRIVRSSNATVGVRAPTFPGINNNGDFGTSFSGSFWLLANSLPSTSLNVDIFTIGMNQTDDANLTLNNLGELRIGRQNSTTMFSPASATLLTTGQWYQISWAFDFSNVNNMRLLAWVNQDTPVELNYSTRYGFNDIFLNVRYGQMDSDAAPGASNFDLCFDDGYVYRAPPINTALLLRTTNEVASATVLEYDNLITSGGTVALSSAQAHEGTQSLRVNRTSAAAIAGETCTFTKPSLGPGGLQHAELSGSFWIYVASRPSGVGDTPIFTVYHPVNDNFDITLSNTGQVRARRQDGTLSSGSAQSSYSATTVPLNTWTQITWTMDGNTGTLVGTVAVNSDTPQSVTWSQAAEVPPWVDFGCKTFSVASNYDIYFDDSYVYEGAIYPATAASVFPGFPNVTSNGTSSADETAFKIQLPARTSAGSSNATASGLRIRLPSDTEGGTSTATAQALRIRLPNRTSAGTSSASATAFLIRLPNRTSAGTSNLTATPTLRIRLPNRTSAGTSNSTATVLMSLLPIRTSAGTSSATATALLIRLPSRTSAGTASSSSAQAFRIRLPNRTSVGTGGGTASLSIRLPARTSAGTSSGTTAGALRIRLPNRTSAGTATATATALRIRLPNRTSAGVGAISGNSLKIRLPNQTTAGTSSCTFGIRIILPARTTAGTSSATATALRVRLPSVTAAGVASTTQTYTQAVTGDKPIDWWHLDETSGATATDSIGSNNGTYSGTIGYAQSSVLPFGGGTSIDLGSAAGKINIADVNDFIGNVPYSVEAWVQFKQPILTGVFDAAFRWVVGKQVPATGRSGWGLGYYFGQTTNSSGPNSGRFFFERWNNDTSSGLVWPASPPIQINPDRQYHVVATYDGASLRLYVNGLLINTSSAGLAIPDTTAGIAIGAFNAANSAAFRGKIDEVAIYDYALNLNQVKAHFSAGNGYSLQIKFPNVTSGGTSSTSALLRTQLPAIASAGTSSISGNNVKIRLPSRTSAGSSTATATALNLSGGAAGFPFVTSSGTSAATCTGLRIRLPNRSTSGVGTVSTSGLRIRLPNRTSAGTSSVAQGGIKIRLPNRTSAGTGNLTQTGLRIRLPNRTAAGTGSVTQGGLRIRLPSRTSAGTSTTSGTNIKDKLPPLTSAGHATCTATGLRIRLPSRTTSGTSSGTAGFLVGGMLAVASHGSSNSTATAFKIRLPSRTVAGTSSCSTTGLKQRMASATSSGHATCTATGFRIRLPGVNVGAHPSTATQAGLRIRLPSRTVTGLSSGAVTAFRIGFVSTTAGTSDLTTLGIRVRMPSVQADGAGGGFAFSFLYIPPPAKVVIASGSSHVVNGSTTSGTVMASRSSDSVLAQSSSGPVPVGDLTKYVEAEP